MITSTLCSNPQFKYKSFSLYCAPPTSLKCVIMNSLNDQLPLSLIAWLVEYCSGTAKVIEQILFTPEFLGQLLLLHKWCSDNWNDHINLVHLFPVQMTFSYIEHIVYILLNRWFSPYVIATKLVDKNKRFLISSFCSSTSNCTLQHC